MTNEESIKELKERYLGMSAYSDREQFQKANQALDMAIEALEKQIPKEVVIKKIDEGIELRYCPRCHVRFIRSGMKYCVECGQALGWREDEEG